MGADHSTLKKATLSMDLQRTTEIIIGVAREAGAHARTGFGAATCTHKHDGTLVTCFDSQSEQLIRAHLRHHWPDHTIYGEEMGFEGPVDNEWIWYLDPIDGTSNFVFGLPIWGASIGLAHRGQPVAGVFYMPQTDETWWAWRGGGAYHNGQRLEVYAPEDMNRTDLVCLSSSILERYHFSFPQKVRCYGSAAHALAMMAGGAFAAVIHDHWYVHDIAAALLMCQEAGAVVTQTDGTTFDSFDGLDPKAKVPALVVTGGKIHERMLAAVTPKG